MLVKILLCTEDTVYAKRLMNYFDKEFGDTTDMIAFSDIEQAISHSTEADILIADEQFEDEIWNAIRNRSVACLSVLLAEKLYETSKDMPVLFKYQRADVLYKELLELYTERGNVRVSQRRVEDSGCKTYVFLSPYGGVGTTTIAKAFAKKNAIYDKVLYLNLQPLNMAWGVQSEEKGLDDIIMALKSRRSILPLKLQSTVMMNAEHVYTYAPSSNPLDVMELTAQDMENLLDGIKELNTYQKIVIDMGTYFSAKESALLKKADSIVCVVDNTQKDCDKLEKFRSYLEILQIKENCRLVRKMELFKNKVAAGLESEFDRLQMKVGGWSPAFKFNSSNEVVDRIAQSDSFESLGMSYAE